MYDRAPASASKSPAATGPPALQTRSGSDSLTSRLIEIEELVLAM
jgi:hypothetical protein